MIKIGLFEGSRGLTPQVSQKTVAKTLLGTESDSPPSMYFQSEKFAVFTVRWHVNTSGNVRFLLFFHVNGFLNIFLT